MTADLAVVVLNWNDAAETITCLHSLRRAEPDAHIVVVDNGSSGDDVERLRASGQADVVLATGANLGYTGGNNRGLERALADGASFVAVLNNDTRVADRALSRLVQTLTAQAGAAAASPEIRRVDDDTVWFAGGVIERGLPRHRTAGEVAASRSKPRDTALLTGCCIVAARAVWQHVGLFDERFFLFFEDSDWSARAVAAGVRLLVDDRAVVWHRVSHSFTGPAAWLGTYYYARNGVRYHWRYQRRHLAHFLWTQVIAPPVRGWRRRGPALPAWPYGWFGAASGLAGAGGPAPGWLERLACRHNARNADTAV